METATDATPETTEQAIELPTPTTFWLRQYADLMAESREIEDKIKIARGHLEEAIGDATAATINGQVVATWKWNTTNRFDQKKAKAFLTPEQIEKSITTTSVRSFRLVGSGAGE